MQSRSCETIMQLRESARGFAVSGAIFVHPYYFSTATVKILAANASYAIDSYLVRNH